MRAMKTFDCYWPRPEAEAPAEPSEPSEPEPGKAAPAGYSDLVLRESLSGIFILRDFLLKEQRHIHMRYGGGNS